MDLVAELKEVSSSLMSQSSASLVASPVTLVAWEADGLRREAILALLMEPVRVRPEAEEFDRVLLRCPSSVAGEEMYEMLDRLVLLGVSTVALDGPAPDTTVWLLLRLSRLAPFRAASSLPVLARAGEATSLCSRLSRRGNVCREGVLEVGVDAEKNAV